MSIKMLADLLIKIACQPLTKIWGVSRQALAIVARVCQPVLAGEALAHSRQVGMRAKQGGEAIIVNGLPDVVAEVPSILRRSGPQSWIA